MIQHKSYLVIGQSQLGRGEGPRQVLLSFVRDRITIGLFPKGILGYISFRQDGGINPCLGQGIETFQDFIEQLSLLHRKFQLTKVSLVKYL